MTAYAEPLVGWRVWHVRRDGTLVSWAKGGEWPAGERLQARCRRHDAPRLGHACGIYAVRERAQAEGLLHALPPLPGAVGIGRVSLWGTVVENSGGWRAQYAYPYDVELLRPDAALARRVAARYAVDAA